LDIETSGGKAIACKADIADSEQVQVMVDATIDAYGSIDILINNNISATTTTNGRPNAANYCSTKAGLNMLTKCMALELGPSIRVNGLGLGFVESPLIHEVFSKEQLAQTIESTPLKRMTTIEETVLFIKLLASESTSFVTGQTIMFDGGRNMR